MQQRFQDRVAKEKAFESESTQLQKALDKREQVVFAKKQAMFYRVQEHKDSAIAFLFEDKLKWQEDKSRLETKTDGGMFPQHVTTLGSVNTTTVKLQHVNNVLVAPNGP